VEEYNSTLLAQDVVQTAASLQVSLIILGLPLHKNGTEQEQSSLTRTFGQELAAMAMARLGPNMKVMLWDERYTSREAAARAQADDPNRWVQGTLDADCACIILETYYDENGEGAEEIVLTDEQRTASLEIYERIKEYQAQGQIAALEKRESTMLKRKEAIARAKKLEDEMRANGTLGESNKSKKKKKRKQAKKKPSSWTAL
jgi:putative Holliday junction resolvase